MSRLFLGQAVCSAPAPEGEKFRMYQSMFPVMLLGQALQDCYHLFFLSPGERWVTFQSADFPLVQSKPEVCFPGTCIGNTDSRHFTNITRAIYRFNPVLLRQDDLPRYELCTGAALGLGPGKGDP